MQEGGVAKICAKCHWVGFGKGWPAGKNPMALVILAWVLRHFLPRKSDKKSPTHTNQALDICNGDFSVFLLCCSNG